MISRQIFMSHDAFVNLKLPEDLVCLADRAEEIISINVPWPTPRDRMRRL
jgi:hypothetical protein